MNFNNPEDIYSSSPSIEDNGSTSEGDAESDSEENAISPVNVEASPSHDSTESSGQLDAALRQAAAHAGTQRFDMLDDDDGDNENDSGDSDRGV